MDKTISSLMTRNILTVDVEDTVEKVEAIMDTHKLSCVPVIDSQGGCFGVISLTDLLHFHVLHKNQNQKAERAWEVCTHKVIEVGPDMSVKEAAELMTRNKIHHIVVVENKSIKGIVSSIDIVNEYLFKQKA